MDEKKYILDMTEDAQTRVLTKEPMWMRFNLIHNMLEKAIEDGVNPETICWSNVNEFLHKNKVSNYDFEFNVQIKDIEEFEFLRKKCLDAPILNTPWQTKSCKECKQTFTLPYSQVQFFERKGLNPPKRCPECRMKRKESCENAGA